MKKRNIQFSSENGQEESIAQKMERNIRAQINKELKEEYDQKKQELEKKISRPNRVFGNAIY